MIESFCTVYSEKKTNNISECGININRKYVYDDATAAHQRAVLFIVLIMNQVHPLFHDFCVMQL